MSNFAQAGRFSAMCGTTVPDWLRQLFKGTEEPEIRRIVASIGAAEQVRTLQANGVDEFHFYTLNRPHSVCAIAQLLRTRPRQESAASDLASV
jgi:methylenetetrahydrofolate reductase (NADPH)